MGQRRVGRVSMGRAYSLDRNFKAKVKQNKSGQDHLQELGIAQEYIIDGLGNSSRDSLWRNTVKFSILKEFRGGSVEEYLRNAFTSVLRNLQEGLIQLDFRENFRSFVVEGQLLPAGVSTQIRNTMGKNEVPRWFLILRQSGGGAVTDGTETWDKDFVSLLNTGGTDATVTAIFFR